MVAKPKRGESNGQALARAVSTQSGGVNFEWTFGAARVDVDTHGASDDILAGLGATSDERLPISLELHRHLSEAAREWIKLKRDPGALYRGARLAQALEWVEDHVDELAAPEREFLKASRTLQVSEYEAAKQRATPLHNRAIYLAAALIAAALMGIAASLFAIRWNETANRNATLAAENAEFAIAVQADANVRANIDAQATAAAITVQRDEARRQAQAARAGQLAAQAQAVLDSYPQRSVLLAIEALNIASYASMHRIPPAADALRQALSSAAEIQLSVPPHGGAVALSRNGRWFASRGPGGAVLLWDVTHPAPVPVVLRAHKFAVSSVAFSAECVSPPEALAERCGRWLATGSWDNTARLWDITAGAPAAEPIVLRGHQAGVEAVAFSPDGRWLATGSRDGTIRLWDVSTGAPTMEPVVLYGHATRVVEVMFSGDGHWLVAEGLDNTVRLWDMTGGAPATKPSLSLVHPAIVTTMASSEDGRWLVTGSTDSIVRLWDITASVSTAKPVLLRGHEAAVWAVAFSGDGHWLATGSRDGTARLWDMTAGVSAAQSVTLRGHADDVRTLAFSVDGHWLATGSRDGTTRLWDVAAGAGTSGPTVLRGYGSPVAVVAFSRDGRWLAAGSEDGTLRWWTFRWDELIDLACRAVGRNFTRAEWRQYFPGEEYRKTCAQWPEGE